jgi:hypothetical protein
VGKRKSKRPKNIILEVDPFALKGFIIPVILAVD